MEIRLIRKSTNSLYTEGELIVNGMHYADTVEATDVMHDTGVYIVTRQFRRYIGHGNSWRESHKDGKILIGEQTIPGIVTSSRPLFDRLADRVKKSKRPIVLIISDYDCRTVKPSNHWK